MNQHYNPCSDGFEAKVWECLRRNQSFREHFQRARDGRSKAYALQYFLHQSEPWANNEFAREVLASPQGWDLTSPWSEIPGPNRERLRAVFNPKEAKALPPFDVAEWQRASRSKLGFLKLLLATKRERRGYRCIEIPEFIRDKQHFDAVAAQVRAFVPKPAQAGRYMKPTGRTLGTRMEWETFLLFEDWKQRGFNVMRARELVAWQLYDRDSFRDEERFLNSPEGRRIANTIGQQRGEHPVGVRISAVSQHIQSVFPIFRPFVLSD